MKKKLHFFISLFIISGGLALNSCNDNSSNKPTDTKDTLVLGPLDTTLVNSMNDSFSPDISFQDTSEEKFMAGKGKLWRVWKKLHKNCQNSEITKGMLYFGVSNTLGIGTIIEYNSATNKYIPDLPMLPEKFNSEQQKLIFNYGTSSACQFAQKLRVNTEFLIKSNMAQTANGELGGIINNARTIDARIESWQVNFLFPSGLGNVLDTGTDPYYKTYDEISKKENRYIVNKEIVINGFSATIASSTAISADLKLALERGITEKIGDTNATVKFSYVNETTIKVTTVGSFVVFVELYKRES